MGPVNTMPAMDAARVEEHAALFSIDGTIIRILHSRGYDTPELIEPFLNPRLGDLHSPFLIDGMSEAVVRMRRAIEDRERIGIFADSDLDGITSLAVMHTLLARFKINPFIRYLKDDENYGITRDIIDEFHHNAVKLLVTVDSGIRDVSEIAYARSLGMDVIITDHHEQDVSLPDAVILNPKVIACSYPFKHLAGVGIAFKFCHALLLSYLPSYGRRFVIIGPVDSGGYVVSCIRNCIAESQVTVSGDDGLLGAVEPIIPEDIILYHVESLPESFIEACGSAVLRPFLDFLLQIFNTPATDLGAICDRLTINRRAYNAEMVILNKLFMEAQLAGSEKVSGFIDSILGLVSIGSIADVIPLVGENRILVKTGIDRLNRIKHPALSKLINGDAINARVIGWGIGPLLNTPGRIGKTELTVSFFIENEPGVLDAVISEIKSLNENRKIFINQFCSKILKDIEAGTIPSFGSLIYIKTGDIPDGYAGLVANRISDATGNPVIVAVLPGKNGFIKGSGRSRGGMEFFSRVEKLRDRFERIGGHENAFGFTARDTDVDGIIRDIGNFLDQRPSAPAMNDICWELDPASITTGFINDIARMEPFGNGNAEPVFISRGIRVESFVQFGNGHGKYIIFEGNPLTAIGWGMGHLMKDYFERGDKLDIIYRLENNIFNGTVSPRMIILEFPACGN
ncbi:MAG: single-stranded-DNA-specific exonuclease RecJ [Spirochaetes bacterium]|nr:single-stranded-DNA-specific exonuclease RecJ [Spirochaetota bacterium]